MASDSNTFTSAPSSYITEELAANYDAIVADENRNTTYEDIAERAAAQGDAQTAAWATQRAEAKTKPAPEETSTAIDYETLKVDDLKAIATERQIDTSTLKLKADLVDALNAAEAAALAAGA